MLATNIRSSGYEGSIIWNVFICWNMHFYLIYCQKSFLPICFFSVTVIKKREIVFLKQYLLPRFFPQPNWCKYCGVFCVPLQLFLLLQLLFQWGIFFMTNQERYLTSSCFNYISKTFYHWKSYYSNLTSYRNSYSLNRL